MSNLLNPAVAPGDSKGVTIFGREPAAYVGLIEVVLSVLFVFNALSWLGLNSAQDVAVFMAVVSAIGGLYVAYSTDTVSVGLLVGAVKAGIALGSVWGLHLTEDRVAMLLLLTNAIWAFVNRQTVNPLADVVRGEVVPDRPDLPVQRSSGGIVGATDVTGTASHVRRPGS